MIRITTDLIEKGHAYQADDGVYFDVESAPEKYGQLTGQSIDAVRSGAGGRVGETGSGKRDHKDFACGSQPSPANRHGTLRGARDGRDGTLSARPCRWTTLEKEFDIHGGGHDLRFPHHEAEICQGECHTGHSPVVHHWLHNGFVNIDGEKMSKSLGNFWTIRDILAKVDAMVLRFALINAHYRSPIDMNEALLNDAERNYNRLLACYVGLSRRKETGPPFLSLIPTSPHLTHSHEPLGLLEKMGEGFARAMDDDFNSREAVAKVLGMVREISKTCWACPWTRPTDNAFAAYAVDLLEETAGRVGCPSLSRGGAWPSRRRIRGKQKLPTR